MYSKPTLQTLMTLIAKTAKEKPGLGHRLSAAYDLLISGRVTPCEWHEGDHLVQASPPKDEKEEKPKEYRVTPESCPCPDYVARGEKACKHRLSVRLFLIAEAEEGER